MMFASEATVELSEGLAVACVSELRGTGFYLDRHCTTPNSHPTNEGIEVPVPASKVLRAAVAAGEADQRRRSRQRTGNNNAHMMHMLRTEMHHSSQLLMLKSVIRCHRFPTEDPFCPFSLFF
jgi:hypothetical protein